LWVKLSLDMRRSRRETIEGEGRSPTVPSSSSTFPAMGASWALPCEPVTGLGLGASLLLLAASWLSASKSAVLRVGPSLLVDLVARIGVVTRTARASFNTLSPGCTSSTAGATALCLMLMGSKKSSACPEKKGNQKGDLFTKACKSEEKCLETFGLNPQNATLCVCRRERLHRFPHEM
jgi:hypothetical protein